jgi:hypothetical protein
MVKVGVKVKCDKYLRMERAYPSITKYLLHLTFTLILTIHPIKKINIMKNQIYI